ncbi:hypothetical protein NIES970_19730 [[Synechococcus] sp. NIES-970]|nr:hypothetical protein NIES970_19730 [[Synechococcus] sp. NIES-970]
MSNPTIVQNQTSTSKDTDIFAILFFLAGAPHIYSFLKGRSQQGASLGNWFLRILCFSGAGTVGAIAWNTF